ncbi:MAG: DUF4358 domain-containing protein [Ruminococcus sp.]|nr:DUF4358 domain-containing protein [Ruminococcus sp.]
MKKVLTILTALILTVALCTACGSAKDVDLKQVMNDVNSTYSLTDMKSIDDTDSLNRYYQIDADSVKQFAAQLPSSASSFNEIILIEAVDSSAADDIKTKLDARLSSQLSSAKSYNAEQVGMIEACEVKESGNYVYLVIGDQHDEIEAAIETALK